jgi:transcription elongation factor Elf1
MRVSPWCREAWQLWRDTLARWRRPVSLEMRTGEMPVLEPMAVCPACDTSATPGAWLSKDGKWWVLHCWECGYRWPQGETRDGWEALREN